MNIHDNNLLHHVLPKGVSFDNLNQKDVDLIFSHINSTPRNSLGFKTPFELFKTAFGIEALKILNINEINKDDIHLKPELIK